MSVREAAAGQRTPPPTYRAQALRALAFLLGFYVLTAAAVVLIVVIVVASIRMGRFRPQLIGALLTAGVLVFAIFRLDRRAGDAEQLWIDAGDQPRLVGLVREVARSLGARPPDSIRLALDVDAFVFQRGRLLGLFPGATTMVLGLPLLAAISVDELRAVVAHEIGHLHRRDTRLGGVVYRARQSMAQAAEGLTGPLGAVFTAYERAFLRSTMRVARAQEVAADQEAMRVAGPTAVAESLLRTATAALAWEWYVGRYVDMVVRAGRWPIDVVQGFRRILDHPERAEQLAGLQRELGTEEATPYDSHPPLVERVAAALAASLGEAPPAPRAPALSLLDDVEGLEHDLSALVGAAATGGDDRGVFWEQVAEEIWQPEQHDYAEAVLEATTWLLARERGIPVEGADTTPATPEDLLELLDRGADEELLRLLDPRFESRDGIEREAVAPLFLDGALFAVLGDALVERHGCRWQLSMAGPIELVDRDGFAIDVERLAEMARTDPDARAAVRAVIARPEHAP